MLKKERQNYILKKVTIQGKAITNDLSEELGVAKDTIRKDFQELAAKGLVKRIHGGILKIQSDIIDFNERINVNLDIKKKLASQAVDLVIDKKVLFIDGGTTNLQFVEALPTSYSGTVITNSPAIALALSKNKNVTIHLIGGHMEHKTKIILGASAVKQIQGINIESCILGVSSISIENGITFPSFDETQLKRELIKRSNQVIAIVDKEKLESVATYYCHDISCIDYLVTDETNPKIIDEYKTRGINVISCDLSEE